MPSIRKVAIQRYHNLVTIRIFRPTLPTLNQLEPYIREIDFARHYSNFGSLSQRLESRFANYIGSNPENVATCVNATLAIQGALKILQESSSPNKWILPVYTFSATAHAAIAADVKFEFHDVDEDMFLESSYIKTNSNVMLTLPFGDSFPASKFQDFNGHLLVDAAASYDALKNFALRDFLYPIVVVVSLHPTKYPPGAEGALVYSNEIKFIKRFRQWTVFGFNEDRESMFPATNGKMNEYSAAVANASLDSWSELSRKLRVKMELIRRISRNSELQVHPALEKDLVSPYWIVRGDSVSEMQSLKNVLRERSIEHRQWWGEGLHKQRAFKPYLSSSNFPICDDIVSRSIALPFYHDIDANALDSIESALVDR